MCIRDRLATDPNPNPSPSPNPNQVRALGTPVLGTEYDALHLRITEVFGRSWDPASTVRAALTANTSRLLYVASDNLDKALELIRAAGSPRRVVTRRDLDAQRVADVLGYLPLAERRRGEFMRELLVDVLTCVHACLLYTSPSPRDATLSRMPSSA